MNHSFHKKLLITGALISLLLLFFSVVPVAHAVVFESGIPSADPTKAELGARGAPLPKELSTYISFLYTFVLGVVGIAGFVSLVVWGVVWTATGIVDKKAMALESIKNTFIGIGLALAAYIILNTISPRFTEINISPLPSMKSTGSGSRTFAPCDISKNTCSSTDVCMVTHTGKAYCIPETQKCFYVPGSYLLGAGTPKEIIKTCKSCVTVVASLSTYLLPVPYVYFVPLGVDCPK